MGCGPCKGDVKRLKNSLPYEEHLGAPKQEGTKTDAKEKNARPDWYDRQNRFWKIPLDPLGVGLTGNEERRVRSTDDREWSVWCSGPGLKIELFPLQDCCVSLSMTNRVGRTSDIFWLEAARKSLQTQKLSGKQCCSSFEKELKRAFKEKPNEDNPQAVKFKIEFVFVRMVFPEESSKPPEERGAGSIMREIFLGAELHGTLCDGKAEPAQNNVVTFQRHTDVVSMRFTYDVFGGPPISKAPLLFEDMNAFYEFLLDKWVCVALAHSADWLPLYVHAQSPPVSLDALLQGDKETLNDRIYNEIVNLSRKQAQEKAYGWEIEQLTKAKEEFQKRMFKKHLLMVEQAGETYAVKHNMEFVTSGVQRVVKENALNVLAIMGPPREGKSTLMNLLIGGIDVDGLDVFPVGNTMNPQTQGADMASWMMPFDCFSQNPSSIGFGGEPITLGFVDVEGLGDKGPQYDVKLYCGIALFSKVLMLNTKSYAKQEFIRNLASIAIAVQRINFGCDPAGKGPHLHVVFRDYQFQVGSPDELKGLWLSEVEGAVDDTKEFNDRLRLAKTFFASIDFWFLPHPSASSNIDDVHKKGRDLLSNDFVEKVTEVRAALVKQLAEPKLFGQGILTGNTFATFLEKAISSLNDASEVDTNELICQFVEDQMKKKREDRITTFEQTITKALDAGELNSVNQFESEWWTESIEKVARKLDEEEKALTKETSTRQSTKFKEAMETRKQMFVELVARAEKTKKLKLKESVGKKVEEFDMETQKMLPVAEQVLVERVRKLEQDIRNNISALRIDAAEAAKVVAEFVEDIEKRSAKWNKENQKITTDRLVQLMHRPWELPELSQHIEIATQSGVDSSNPTMTDAAQQLALAAEWQEKKRSIETKSVDKQVREMRTLVNDAGRCPANLKELVHTREWCAKADHFLKTLPKNVRAEERLRLVARAQDLRLSEHPDVKQLVDIASLLGPEKDAFKNAEGAMNYWSMARNSFNKGQENGAIPLPAEHVASILVKQAIRPDEPLKKKKNSLVSDQHTSSGIKFVAHGLLKFRSESIHAPSDKLNPQTMKQTLVSSAIKAKEFVCVHDCAGVVFKDTNASDNDPLQKFVIFKFYQGVIWHSISTHGIRLQKARTRITGVSTECKDLQAQLRLYSDIESPEMLGIQSKLESLIKEVGKDLEPGDESGKDKDKEIDTDVLQSLSLDVGRKEYREEQLKLIKLIRREPPPRAMAMAAHNTERVIESLDTTARKFENSSTDCADRLLRLKVLAEQRVAVPVPKPIFDECADSSACVVPIEARAVETYKQTELSTQMDDDVYKFLSFMTGGTGEICLVKEFLYVMEHASFGGLEADEEGVKVAVRGQIEDTLQRSLNLFKRRGAGIFWDETLRRWLFDFLKRRQHFDVMVCQRLRKLSPEISVLEHTLPRDVTIALTKVCDDDTKKFILPLMQEIGMAIPIYYVWADVSSITGDDGPESKNNPVLQECIDLTALECCDIETGWVVNIGTSKTQGKTKLLKILYGMEDTSMTSRSGLNHLHDTTFIDMVPAWKINKTKILLADVHNFSMEKATEAGVWRTLASLARFNHLTILQLSANDFEGTQVSEDVKALMSQILKVSDAKVLCFFRDYERNQEHLFDQTSKWLQDELQEKYVGMWQVNDIHLNIDGFRNGELPDLLEEQRQDGTQNTGPQLKQCLVADPSQMFEAAKKQRNITMYHGVHTIFDPFPKGFKNAQNPNKNRGLNGYNPMPRVHSTASGSSQQPVSLLDIRRVVTELLNTSSKDKHFARDLFPFTVRNVKLEDIKKRRHIKEQELADSAGAGFAKKAEIDKHRRELDQEKEQVDQACINQCKKTNAHDLMKWFGKAVARRDFDKIKELGTILYEWRQSKKMDDNLLALDQIRKKKLDIQATLDDRTTKLQEPDRKKMEAQIKDLEHRYRELRAATDQYNISVDSFWHELMFRSDIRRHDDMYTNLPKLDEAELDIFALIDCYSEYLKLGNSVHFLHGDPLYFGTSIPDENGGMVAQDFIGSLLEELDTTVGDRRILVISVIGMQSSGKSTLMNYIFGCSFATSVGRCTTGMFFSILETDTEVILIMDTEGLLSVEARTGVFDKQVSLMTIACSDLVIINNRGELSAAVQELFTVCMFALEQMSHLRTKESRPKLAFVLQSVNDVSSAMKKDWLAHVKAKLVEAVQSLKKRDEASTVINLGDLIDLQDDAIFTLPVTVHEENQPIGLVRKHNSTYSHLALKLRNELLLLCKSKRRVASSLSSWYKHAKQVWESLEKVGEAIMHFKDAYQIKQAMDLSREVQTIIRKMEEEMRHSCTTTLKGFEDACRNFHREKEVQDAADKVMNAINTEGENIYLKMEEAFDTFVKTQNIQDPVLKIQQKRKLYFPTQLTKATYHNMLERLHQDKKADLIVQKQNEDLLSKVQDALNQHLESHKGTTKLDEKKLNEIVDAVSRTEHQLEPFSIAKVKHQMLREIVGNLSKVAMRHQGQARILERDLEEYDKNTFHSSFWCSPPKRGDGKKGEKDDEMREIPVTEIFRSCRPLSNCQNYLEENPEWSMGERWGQIKAKLHRTGLTASSIDQKEIVAKIFSEKFQQMFTAIQGKLNACKGLMMLDHIPVVYDETMNLCLDLEERLNRDHPIFCLKDTSFGFIHKIAVAMMWLIWHRVVYDSFIAFSDRKKKASQEVSSIKEQVKAAYLTGVEDKDVAFVLADTCFKEITANISKASVALMEEIAVNMDLCTSSPSDACKFAIQRSFKLRDHHACLMYCIDTTKYLKLLFNQEVTRGQLRVVEDQSSQIKNRCESVRKAILRIVKAWNTDPKKSSTVGDLLTTIRNDKEVLDADTKAMLQDCGRPLRIDKLQDKPIKGTNSKAFYSGFEQKLNTLMGVSVSAAKTKDTQDFQATVETNVKKAIKDWAQGRWPDVQGCRARCPRCGSKCTLHDHSKDRIPMPHQCDLHMLPCLNGWRYYRSHTPMFMHCREGKAWEEGVITTKEGREIHFKTVKEYYEQHHKDWLEHAEAGNPQPPKANAPEYNYEKSHQTEVEDLQQFWAIAKHAIMKMPKCSGMIFNDQDEEWEARLRGKVNPADWGEEAYLKAQKELDDVDI